jgi:hypothetical protein
MDIFIKSLKKSIEHLEELDSVFSTFSYPDKEEYLRNREKINELNVKIPNSKFTDELYYGDDGRQMILNDIMEYIFNGRGYFYMWKGTEIEKKNNFVKIVLYFINQLMILESISVNYELRNKVLDSLKNRIGEDDFFKDINSKKTFESLMQFQGDVHFDTAKTNIVPEAIQTQLGLSDVDVLNRFDKYTDSLIPKLPHGLWRELIVYIQLLRINAGYILPLLLNQRIISKNDFLKPPDFLIIKDDGSLIGVEVGSGKEEQSSNFSAKLKCQMITAENSNIPPRCPICGKWILFCDKVIEEFSDLDNPLLYKYDDVRCAHDCDKFSYEQVLAGECPYIKYRGKISSSLNPKQKINFEKSYYHYHYSCILDKNDTTAKNEILRQKNRWEAHKESRGTNETSKRMTINCLKTNYPYFDGLEKIENYNKKNLICYSKYLKNKSCEKCKFDTDCQRLSKIIPLIDSEETGDKEQLKMEIRKLIDVENYFSIM